MKIHIEKENMLESIKRKTLDNIYLPKRKKSKYTINTRKCILLDEKRTDEDNKKKELNKKKKIITLKNEKIEDYFYIQNLLPICEEFLLRKNDHNVLEIPQTMSQNKKEIQKESLKETGNIQEKEQKTRNDSNSNECSFSDATIHSIYNSPEKNRDISKSFSYFSNDHEHSLKNLRNAYDRACLLNVIDKKDNSPKVIKVINKEKVLKAFGNFWKKTMEHIISLERHINLMEIFCIYDDNTNFYIVTEKLHGKELFSFLVNKKKVKKTVCQYIMKQILEAVNHLHMNNIIHRDIKPENFMFRNKKRRTKNWKYNYELVLIDFDTCHLFDTNNVISYEKNLYFERKNNSVAVINETNSTPTCNEKERRQERREMYEILNRKPQETSQETSHETSQETPKEKLKETLNETTAVIPKECERQMKKKSQKLIGTFGYIAPEILKGIDYSKASDMWSIGIIFYILMTGVTPLPMCLMVDYQNTKEILLRKEKKGINFNFPSFNKYTSSQNLVKQLLDFNPSNRMPNCFVASQHPWVHVEDNVKNQNYYIPSNLQKKKNCYEPKHDRISKETIENFNKKNNEPIGMYEIYDDETKDVYISNITKWNKNYNDQINDMINNNMYVKKEQPQICTGEEMKANDILNKESAIFLYEQMKRMEQTDQEKTDKRYCYTLDVKNVNYFDQKNSHHIMNQHIHKHEHQVFDLFSNVFNDIKYNENANEKQELCDFLKIKNHVNDSRKELLLASPLGLADPLNKHIRNDLDANTLNNVNLCCQVRRPFFHHINNFSRNRENNENFSLLLKNDENGFKEKYSIFNKNLTNFKYDNFNNFNYITSNNRINIKNSRLLEHICKSCGGKIENTLCNAKDTYFRETLSKVPNNISYNDVSSNENIECSNNLIYNSNNVREFSGFFHFFPKKKELHNAYLKYLQMFNTNLKFFENKKLHPKYLQDMDAKKTWGNINHFDSSTILDDNFLHNMSDRNIIEQERLINEHFNIDEYSINYILNNTCDQNFIQMFEYLIEKKNFRNIFLNQSKHYMQQKMFQSQNMVTDRMNKNLDIENIPYFTDKNRVSLVNEEMSFNILGVEKSGKEALTNFELRNISFFNKASKMDTKKQKWN